MKELQEVVFNAPVEGVVEVALAILQVEVSAPVDSLVGGQVQSGMHYLEKTKQKR